MSNKTFKVNNEEFEKRYVKFDEKLEKSLIRNCINNKMDYNEKIVKVFK